MPGYGQFCPVAKAMEVLDERWTLLVVRELLLGSTRFNELRRGNPRMSPALLAKRLRTLERAGVVRRDEVDGHPAYTLTESGRELMDVVMSLGAWGARWAGDLGAGDLDPHLLMWDIRRSVPVEAWPRARTVLALHFDDVAPRQADWWIVVAHGEADVCDLDPGYEPAARVRTSLWALTRVWRGDVSWEQAVARGEVVLDGPAEVRREVPAWVGQGTFATVPRPELAGTAG